jgi:hypothetical protein
LCGCASTPAGAAGHADLRRLLAPYSGQWESEDLVGQTELRSMDTVRYRLDLVRTSGADELHGDLGMYRQTSGSGMRQMVKFTRVPRVSYTAAVKCSQQQPKDNSYSCVMQLSRTNCSGSDCFLTCPDLVIEDGHLSSSNEDSACHYRRPFRY